MPHLTSQGFDITPFPAVADNHNDRPTSKHSPTPMPIEGADRLADPRTTSPIIDFLTCLTKRLIDFSKSKLVGNP
jgi:hypothetical protein